MRRIIGKKGMLVVFTLAIGGMLLASCGGDDNDDGLSLASNETAYGMNIISSVYEADWILDQQVVDHTTISFKGDSLQISHFPNEQLLAWMGGGYVSGYSFSDTHSFEYEEVNGVNLGLSNVGNSNNSSYYETLLVNTNYQISLYNLINYDVQIETLNNRLTAVKDQINDKWSISWQITKIILVSPETPKIFENTYDPPLSLMLVTTKHIK